MKVAFDLVVRGHYWAMAKCWTFGSSVAYRPEPAASRSRCLKGWVLAAETIERRR